MARDGSMVDADEKRAEAAIGRAGERDLAPTANADARREADAEKARERTARLPKIIAGRRALGQRDVENEVKMSGCVMAPLKPSFPPLFGDGKTPNSCDSGLFTRRLPAPNVGG